MHEHTRDAFDFRPRWWTVGVTCAALVIIGMWMATYLTLGVAINGLRGPLRGEWSWSSLIVIDVLTLWIFWTLAWLFLQQALTKFSVDGVTQPTLFGAKQIKWQEVRWVSPRRLRLGGAQTTIGVSIAMFKDAELLVRAVLDRVPPTAELKW
jgi:hypothetical protein